MNLLLLLPLTLLVANHPPPPLPLPLLLVTSDGFTCDASLMVENETLKREVDELTHALGKAYGGEARLLKCLGSQMFSLNKEGLGYTPKKGKATFVTPKPSFVRGNGQLCHSCK